jgi:aspartyl-tRNA(Asn)/glutamyl-tRNA(Gln) amidotransferase subunit A
VFPVSWTFDTVGPLARCAEDVAAVHAVLAGYDPDDPASVDRPVDDVLSGLDGGVEGLRIGLATGFFLDDVDAEIVAGTRVVADLLARLGASVTELRIEGAVEAFEACATMIRGDAVAVHEQRLAESPERFGEDVRRRLEASRAATAADYGRAREEGRRFRRHLDGVFGGLDAILSPTSGVAAPDAGAEMIETTRRLTQLTYGWSLAALPGLSLPAGLTAAGLPFGVQLVTDSWQEALLLRIGAAVQRETDWHLRRPALLAGAAR